MAFRTLAISQGRLFHHGKAAASDGCVGGQTVRHGGRAELGILRQRRQEQRCTLENQPLTGVHHAVNDGAFQKLATRPHHHPAQAVQPAPIMEGAKEPLDIGAVLDQDEGVQAVRPFQRLPRVAAHDAGTGGPPQHLGHMFKVGGNRHHG